MDDFDCVVACPEPVAPGAEEEEALEGPAEAASAARTLLPHRAQESSCSSTGDTPSSTRKLTWRRKYRTAAGRGDGGSALTQLRDSHTRMGAPAPDARAALLPPPPLSRFSAGSSQKNLHPLWKCLTSTATTTQRLAPSPHSFEEDDSPP